MRACVDALNEEPSRSAARIKEAEANSWRARSEQLLEAFRQAGWLGRPIPRPRRSAAKLGKEGEKKGDVSADSGAGALGKEGGDVWEGRTGLCETPL